jgi:hypothetical protein
MEKSRILTKLELSGKQFYIDGSFGTIDRGQNINYFVFINISINIVKFLNTINKFSNRN